MKFYETLNICNY